MNPQQLQQLVHIPLKSAFICLEVDCGEIGNSNSYCPACHSTKVWPLTKWVAELVTRYSKEEMQAQTGDGAVAEDFSNA